jgi:hypothetical protein
MFPVFPLTVNVVLLPEQTELIPEIVPATAVFVEVTDPLNVNELMENVPFVLIELQPYKRKVTAVVKF